MEKKKLNYFLNDKETTGRFVRKVTDTPKPSVRQILKVLFGKDQ